MTRLAIFRGHAAFFNHPDLVRDVILPGAFAKSLARRGVRGVRMLYQHDAAEPIGFWRSLFEDRRGLAVEGELVLETKRGRETLALLEAGALDGLSIGFRAVRARTDRRSGTRLLHEIDLIEISIVTFPMHPQARATAGHNALAGLFTRAAQSLSPSIANPGSRRITKEHFHERHP